jgi:hypothetical protein
MNIIRILKEQRTHQLKLREKKSLLERIPKSRLLGISALPVELWGMIIGKVVGQDLESICYHYPRSCAMRRGMEMRVVCRKCVTLPTQSNTDELDVFDQEIRQQLHKRITLLQLPYLGFLLELSRAGTGDFVYMPLRNALLASALYNSCRSSTTATMLRNIDPRLHITDRIFNCTLIAQHMDRQHSASHQHDLIRMFCTAASTSLCCWQYIFQWRSTRVEKRYTYMDCRDANVVEDVYLEAALLVASGYGIEAVKRWMIKLGRGKKLKRSTSENWHREEWDGGMCVEVYIGDRYIL